jgi:alpha-galactosidase
MNIGVRRLSPIVIIAAHLVTGFATFARAATVVRAGFAFISNDPAAGTWTVSSSGASLLLDINAASDFAVRLVSPSGKTWTVGAQTDTVVRIGSQSVPFGSRASGFVFQGVETSVRDLTVRLDATYDLPAARVRVTRHYAAASGSPAFETWTTFAPIGATVTLANLNAFSLSVQPGTIHWLSGLQQVGGTQSAGGAFTLHERTLAVGDRLSFGSAGRSSEQTVPWFAIDGESDEFFAALLWSGAWSLTAVRSASAIDLSLELAPMSTTAAAIVDGPHAVLGVARGGLPAVSAALRTFVIDGLRGRHPFEALVTFNTWFAYGTHIDEASMMAEIEGAAALGAELFMLDAGWYVGAARSDAADFLGGLGTWQIDASRFPNGLRVLSDRAHELGMKFGIWIEPERVALSTVNQRGLAQEAWLAKAADKYGDAQAAQLCLGGPSARQWVFDQIVRLVDAVQPDYLKWDNNFWINCDRSGHGHGRTDGSFAHVNGLYQVLADVRARYPDLLIENVSGGGNRLDLGMLRYTDVAWMDDRSSPSVRVRHNIEGLITVFPPAYLLSFVVEDVSESLHNAEDMALYFRSRMTAALGLCFRTAGFDEVDVAQMTREIGIYKDVRLGLRGAAATLLTPQAVAGQGPPWDVLQTIPSGNRDTFVAAFQSDGGASPITIKPVGLRAFTWYDVESVDAGELGSATGADLMSQGITIVPSPFSAAHIVVLRPARRPE